MGGQMLRQKCRFATQIMIQQNIQVGRNKENNWFKKQQEHS